MSVGFSVLGTAGAARAGVLHTRRGEILTPVFMPVATRAAFRQLSMEDARSTGARIILSNTYHLLDAPGPEVFTTFSGIHRFMGWQGAVLTDSGGYQIFSVPGERNISKRGAHFRLPSGRRHVLTPESSIYMQQAMDSDIMMVLDVCVASTSDEARTRQAMLTTHAWAIRSLEAHASRQRRQETAQGLTAQGLTAQGLTAQGLTAQGLTAQGLTAQGLTAQGLTAQGLEHATRGQALFGIVQGGVHRALREESAAAVSALPFDGYAIGGLAVGETRAERESMTALCTRLLPQNKPRYLMGVGTPLDLVEAVQRGVDMFDCILPTKMAEQGFAYTFQGVLEAKRPSMQHAPGPIEPGCPCLACQSQPLGYVHHLLRVDNAQGARWLAIHNICHTQRLMSELRAAILASTWDLLHAKLRERLGRRLKAPLLTDAD